MCSHPTTHLAGRVTLREAGYACGVVALTAFAALLIAGPYYFDCRSGLTKC